MADEPSEGKSEPTDENVNPIAEPDKLPDNPPADKPSHSQTVKVDLGELRDLIEGLPEKTAQFIKEAVSTPKKTAAPTTKSEPKKVENAPAEPSNDTPKQSTGPKRGWLANALFGK
ncbi:MAG TPA: hypothetical protein VGE93_06425 [Bryobacteraceae bacterium]